MDDDFQRKPIFRPIQDPSDNANGFMPLLPVPMLRRCESAPMMISRPRQVGDTIQRTRSGDLDFFSSEKRCPSRDSSRTIPLSPQRFGSVGGVDSYERSRSAAAAEHYSTPKSGDEGPELIGKWNPVHPFSTQNSLSLLDSKIKPQPVRSASQPCPRGNTAYSARHATVADALPDDKGTPEKKRRSAWRRIGVSDDTDFNTPTFQTPPHKIRRLPRPSPRRGVAGSSSLDIANAGSTPGHKPKAKGKGSRSRRSSSTPQKQKKKLKNLSKEILRALADMRCTTQDQIMSRLFNSFLTEVERNEQTEKSIRRRMYDTLNVLEALGLVSKDKQQILWTGEPRSEKSTTADDPKVIQATRGKISAIKSRIREKRGRLQHEQLQFNRLKSLLDRNRKRTRVCKEDQKCFFPFLLVKLGASDPVTCSASMKCHRQELEFRDQNYILFNDYDLLKIMAEGRKNHTV